MHNTSKRFSSLVALGLSTLLPSFAFGAESDEALTSLLAQAPSNPSQIRNLQAYSPVVDLRTQRATVDYTQNPPFPSGGTWNQDTTINVNLQNVGVMEDGNRFFNANNQAHVTMNFTVANPMTGGGLQNIGILAAQLNQIVFQGNGFFDITANITNQNEADTNSFIGAWDNHLVDVLFSISSPFRFVAQGKTQNFLLVYSFGGYGDGKYLLNSPYIEIDMSKNTASNKNIIKLSNSFGTVNVGNPTFFINANESDPTKAHNTSNVLKFTGNIQLDRGIFYANFTNNQSFFKGNLELGEGKSNISFSGGSRLTGNIDFIKQSGTNVTIGTGTHTITFDQASFIGSVKNSGTNGNSSKGINTTITFKNTAGRTFGNGTDDIVANTFKGAINGFFDVSASSITRINGSSDGTKGFQGSGTNNLTFDFRGNAKSGLKSNVQKQFTIGGGNANSTYTLNAFTKQGESELDLSNLNSNGSSLFSKIKDAGINIQTTNGTKLQGTLLFTNTNIKVSNNGSSSGDNALFAKAENINTGFQSSNGLTLGAMFGNAIWDDKNKDGYITQDEITANSGGTTYKLTGANGSESSSNTNKDDKTSTGNIGKANDNIKKRIGFIFANGTGENQGYVFGGDKQGYSGNIAGGTEDSKYYFANAGYLNRSQVEDAKGDLVLFNTAFRGDLGVKNKDVNIFLDFSNNRNGLRAETNNDNANIVGSGSKNIVFNFTDNTLKEKYKGAVVGDATKTNTANPGSSTPGSAGTGGTDSDTATYTILNLKKYSADGTLDGQGFLSLNNNGTQAVVDSGTGKTLINALQDSGLTNFDKPDAQSIKDNYESNSSSGHSSRARRELPNTVTLASSADSSLSTSSTSSTDTPSPKQKDSVTNIENLSKTNTTLSLRGTSLDTTGISFNDYKYDLAFGTGMGTIEGVKIADSKLKGTIDLSSNTNKGHKIMMKGDSIEGESVEIKFKDNQSNFGSDNDGGYFYYDDSSATEGGKTLKLTGLKQTNFLRSDSMLKFSNTNLEGNLWASANTPLNLDFRKNTWKMDESGIQLRGNGESNIQIYGKVAKLNEGSQGRAGETTPVLKLRMNKDNSSRRLEFINTGMTVKFWEQGGGWGKDTRLGQKFNFRGTSLETYWKGDETPPNNDTVDGLHGYADYGINLVFAKGTNLDTTVAKASQKAGEAGNYKITDEALDKDPTYKGEYTLDGYTGNYIAESYGKFTKVVTHDNKSAILTFIGENSFDQTKWAKGSHYGNGSKITFVNASAGSNGTSNRVSSDSSSGALNATKLGDLLSDNNGTGNSGHRLDVLLEGTSLSNGNSLVARTAQQDKLYFKMTFVKEDTANTNLVSSEASTASDPSSSTTSTDSTYVSNKYTNLATTKANGALKDSILKVAQSSLVNGVDFKDSNFDVLFVGNKAQELDGSGANGNTKVFKGGSSTSIVTFRDSDLNAGNGTSSLQNIKGTIAFDLSHQNEEMKITGTLSNMFGNSNSGSNDSYNGTGKYQTKFSNTTINKLVFVKMSDAESSTTLGNLKTNGLYFNDLDTFGDLSKNDYSALGKIKDANKNNNSDLILEGGTIALKGANQEIFFIGKDSHGFDDPASGGGSGGSRTNTASKLGDSSGSTLTFIDAGELKVENLVNANGGSGSSSQQGKGTINLIGSTRIELKDSVAGAGVRVPDSSGSTQMKTLTLASTQSSGGAGVPGTGGVPGAGTPAVASGVAGAGTATPTLAITGEGITINAVFTGSNALVSNDSSKQRIKGESTTDAEDLKNGNFYASDVHIGQAGEKTTYHILFDYTDALGDKAKKGFGKYHTYLGNINGLESDSIIKFKNAGYINEDQIKGTKATIFLDNTQLKGDFRADVAVLDFRDNSPAISGNILTSDTKSSDAVLSRKLLTFDLTNSTKALNFQGAIQAGYKIAPEYTQDGQSILTFQNAPTLNLGAKAATQASDSSNGTANSSSFIQALATDAGFSGIKNAKTTADGFGTAAAGRDANSTNKQAYILSGTKLAFEGTNITANGESKAIKEDLYELDLSFDNRADGSRGQTGLGETLGKSTLTANSITMGEAKTNSGSANPSGRDVSSSEAKNPLGLSLAFYDKGSLTADTSKEGTGISNVLEVKLKDNARFNLVAQSSNGNIGTLVL